MTTPDNNPERDLSYQEEATLRDLAGCLPHPFRKIGEAVTRVFAGLGDEGALGALEQRDLDLYAGSVFRHPVKNLLTDIATLGMTSEEIDREAARPDEAN